MKIVYVVTQGNYSAYRICGVYSTKAQAEVAQHVWELRNPSYSDEPTRIEQYEMNSTPEIRQPGMEAWSVRIQRDGSVILAGASDWLDDGELTEEYEPNSLNQYTATFSMWARNREHAVKVANERRIQMIALDRWPKKGKK